MILHDNLKEGTKFMAIDGIILNKVVTDIKNQFPARINKIYQISKEELLFNLRCDGKKKTLMISAHSVFNRIHFTDKKYDNPEEPTNFVLLLRKHLEGGTIFNIEQVGLDRYLKMEVAHRNQIGDKKIITVYIELMGKYANFILVNEDNKIIDALKRIPPYENSIRIIHPGATYVKPKAQEKSNPFTTFDFNPEESLTSQFHGFSPLLSREIEFRLNNQTFEEIMKEIENSNSIYITKTKNDMQFHVIPLLHLLGDYKKCDLHLGFDDFYYQLAEQERIKQVTGNLTKIIRRQIKIYNKKLPKLLEGYDESLDCDKWRIYGDLLYSNPNIDTKGKTEITLNDFEGNTVTIPINSKSDLKTNAKKCFQKYNKTKKSQSYIKEQIELTKSEIEYLTAVLDQIEIATVKDANEIKDELIKNRYLKSKLFVNKKSKKKKKKINVPNITILKYKGHTISFGKNNIQNDYITFKLARKDYTWFHAKDFHGSHCIIDTNELDEDLIRYCANIAAYYSKARYSSSVPVNYCEVRKLKKIPGSKLGLVSLSNYKTIYIDPEPIV
jgi:predicted ribosome quality control (RQC) complex YloA/Tae2 family protein